MKVRTFISVFLFFTMLSTAFSQYKSSKTFSYYNDYIVTKKDTLYGKIDERTINTSFIKYMPVGEEKEKKIKATKIIELKSRYIYKQVDVNGSFKLLKVLTEDYLSLYSEEKKGVNTISDKKPEEFTMSREVPARSTFYLLKKGQIAQLDRENYKAVLRHYFEDDEKILARIDELKFEDLEFQLLNMVIAYDFRLKNSSE